MCKRPFSLFCRMKGRICALIDARHRLVGGHWFHGPCMLLTLPFIHMRRVRFAWRIEPEIEDAICCPGSAPIGTSRFASTELLVKELYNDLFSLKPWLQTSSAAFWGLLAAHKMESRCPRVLHWMHGSGTCPTSRIHLSNSWLSAPHVNAAL